MVIGPFITETSKKDSPHKKRRGWVGKGKVKRQNQQKKLTVEKKKQLTDENIWKKQWISQLELLCTE